MQLFSKIILILIFSTVPVNADELISLDTRNGVKQKFLLIKPDNPIATVILFKGGKGIIRLNSTSINNKQKNFLIRTRELFAKHNLMVAVIDAPTDKYSKNGMKNGFRTTAEHVTDIDAVISYLKAQSDIPIWLVGTSRGSESAAYLAINLPTKVEGLVLTSSLTVTDDKGTSLTDMPLNKISIPTLVIANSDDKCRVTPPSDATMITKMLINSTNAQLKMFSGGNKPISKPCKAMSYHGFFGIEDSVIDYIADFIKS